MATLPRADQASHLFLEEVPMRFLSITLVLTLFGFIGLASANQPFKAPAPKITSAVAFDVSTPVSSLPPLSGLAAGTENWGIVKEVRPEI